MIFNPFTGLLWLFRKSAAPSATPYRFVVRTVSGKREDAWFTDVPITSEELCDLRMDGRAYDVEDLVDGLAA